MSAAFRAALIRKINKEMDRIDHSRLGPRSEEVLGYAEAYHDGLAEGQLQGLSYVLWLIKDTEDV